MIILESCNFLAACRLVHMLSSVSAKRDRASERPCNARGGSLGKKPYID